MKIINYKNPKFIDHHDLLVDLVELQVRAISFLIHKKIIFKKLFLKKIR